MGFKQLGMILCLWMSLLCSNSWASDRIITYNIRYDHKDDGELSWSHRKENVVTLLQFYSPDIFCVQEALVNQMQYLHKNMKTFKYVGVGREDGKKQGEYSAIFYSKSRYTALKDGHFWLSETPNEPSMGWDAACPRICTWVKLQNNITKEKFYVFNTHLDHVGKVAPKESVKLILKKISEINKNSLPVMVTGDFNKTSQFPSIQMMKNGNLTPSCEVSKVPMYGPSGTFNHQGNGHFGFDGEVVDKIDYIFVSPKVRVSRCGVLSDSKDCFYFSDHLPVLVDWNIKQ